MYQNLYYDKANEHIHLWDDMDGYECIDYKPYCYRRTKAKSKFKHLNGFNVTKHFGRSKKTDFEVDMPASTRFLVDKYTNTEPSKNIRTLYFDIEVEKTEKGWSNSLETENRINAISFSFNTKKLNFVFVLVDEPQKKLVDGNTHVIFFTSEEKLLQAFIQFFELYKPHIVTHWNGDDYDIPYVCNRTMKILGDSWLNKLSPIGIVKPKRKDDFSSWVIAGVSSLDYMLLYKNFTYKVLSSYSLDFVCKLELGRGKVEYDGDLGTLYKTDLPKFIQYSLTDVELLMALDAKLDFIELARSVCHMGFVPYDNVYMSSRWLEGASIAYLKARGIVASNKKKKVLYELDKFISRGATTIELKNKIDGNTPTNGILKIFKSVSSFEIIEFTHYIDNVFYLKEPLKIDLDPKKIIKIVIALVGAYVQEPIPGVYDWVYDIDLTSLYPSIIRTLNISPETKFGRIYNFDLDAYLNGSTKKYKFKFADKTNVVFSHTELKDLITKNKLSIAANGALYTQDRIGFIPAILTEWFNARVKQKNLKKKYGKEGNNVLKKYYHQRQLTTKIMLNAFYGVLGLNTFRFYDIDNAEAITLSGQYIIKWSAKEGNNWYNNKLHNKLGVDNYVIYIDTDSVAGDSLVRTNKGNMPIMDFYDDLLKTNEEYIDPTSRKFIFPKNAQLPFFDEENKKIITGDVEYIEKHNVRKKMYKITSESGKEIVVTEDHSIMILRNDKLVECKPTEIEITNEIITILCPDNMKYNIEGISKVECLGEQELEMYDVGMVDTPHTFFANDILVHNSCFFSSKPILNKFHPEIVLDYQIKTDNSLKVKNKNDSKLYKDFDNWIQYNEWLINLTNKLVTKSYLDKNSAPNYVDKYIGTVDNNIPFYKLQTYVKDNYSTETACYEIIAVNYTLKYARQVQKHINDSYDILCYDIFNVTTGRHELEIKQEYVAKRALWLAKKRYAHYIIDNEGIPVSELDVKGIDVVRSDFPKVFRDSLKTIIINLLNYGHTNKEIDLFLSELNDEIPKLDLSQIGKPTGVNNVEKYKENPKKTPPHVQAALNYNLMLELDKDIMTPHIKSGEKIKWYYLKPNSLGFDKMALKGHEDNQFIVNFVEQHIDYDMMYSKFTKKVQDVYDACGWGEINLNKDVAFFFDF